jgi:transposase
VIALAELAERVDRLEQEAVTIRRERDEYKKLYELLREENERLKRGLLGQKAERLPRNDAQLSLALLGLMKQQDEGSETPGDENDSASEQEVAAHTRRRAKRKPLPAELPRVVFEITPPEVERGGTDAFEVIGEDVREVLERRPGSHVVVRIIRKKYVRRDRDREATEVFIAEAPELPIERGLAGPGKLADTIVKRWAEHQPLHRQEATNQREGIELARSTMCEWHIMLAALCRPLVEAMLADAFKAPYLCTDATGVLVQASGRCKNGHFWVLVAPGKHVLYRYTARHDGAAVDELLAGYKGYLVADAHVVYDHLYATGDVTEVGCWAHCRRYFHKALESDPERAKAALAFIATLFRIERSIATAPRKKKEQARQRQSKPIVDRFFAWCDTERDTVLDESPISKAINYARNQRDALQRFIDDGRLPLHNNISELALRRQVVGRRNWLFIGSDDGAEANTTFVSLLASCALHDIEPWAYLRDLFILLPGWPRSRVLELAPANWKATLEKDEAQQKLAANVFRRALLDPGS